MIKVTGTLFGFYIMLCYARDSKRGWGMDKHKLKVKEIDLTITLHAMGELEDIHDFVYLVRNEKGFDANFNEDGYIYVTGPSENKINNLIKSIVSKINSENGSLE